MHCRPLSLLLLAAALLTACASAGDRLNEGMQLQAEGRYMEAAYRYADAVDKDETLTEAHERLGTVAASALQRTMDSAEDLSGGGDPIAAADALLSGDRLQRVGTRDRSLRARRVSRKSARTRPRQERGPTLRPGRDRRPTRYDRAGNVDGTRRQCRGSTLRSRAVAGALVVAWGARACCWPPSPTAAWTCGTVQPSSPRPSRCVSPNSATSPLAPSHPAA